MTRHYFVDQTNTPDPRIWTGGRLVEASDPLPNGRSGFLVTHLPGFDLYEAIEDATRPGQYQRWADPRYALVYEPNADPALSRVRETAQIVDNTLDESFQAKQDELEQYTREVSESAFEHDVGGLEFWAVASQPIRNVRGSYNGYLATRIGDQLFGAVDHGIAQGGGNTNSEIAAFWNKLKESVLSGNGALYWERDIRVVLYDRVTLQQVRDNANQNQWSGLQESQGAFDWQWRNANDRVKADIDTAYNDNDKLQLEQIDVRDPLYNWPPHYTGQWTPGTITIATMMAR